MPPEPRLRVLVADDLPLFRVSLVRAVEQHPRLQVAGEAHDGRAALELLRTTVPDVAIVDLGLRGPDGLGVLAEAARAELPTRLMLIATAFTEEDLRRASALRAAAVLSKRMEGAGVVDAILAVGRGETVRDPAVVTVARDDPRFARAEARPLTPREREVLQLLAAGRSGPEIARQLYLSPSTIKTHIEKVYDKLGVSHRGAAVAEAMRRGLVE